MIAESGCIRDLWVKGEKIWEKLKSIEVGPSLPGKDLALYLYRVYMLLSNKVKRKLFYYLKNKKNEIKKYERSNINMRVFIVGYY